MGEELLPKQGGRDRPWSVLQRMGACRAVPLCTEKGWEGVECEQAGLLRC